MVRAPSTGPSGNDNDRRAAMGTIRSYMAAMITALLLAVAAFPGIASAQLAVGQKLPSLTGRNLVGETVSIDAAWKDSIGVIAFWSIYCKPCVAEITSLVKLQERYQGKVSVIGINIDGELPPPRVRTFVERYEKFRNTKINYKIVFDEKNQITKQLGVGFLPTVLAVDKTGTIINVFVGFEEKDEEAIFRGIEKMLPMAGAPAAEAETNVVETDVRIPICGFYDETGWRESFYGNKDRDKEIDRAAAEGREASYKTALRETLRGIGVSLAENDDGYECMKPYGVLLHESPLKERDSLTNLLNALNHKKYTSVIETRERAVGTDYCVWQKISVNVMSLRDDLERVGLSLKPSTVSFVAINMGPYERMRFLETVQAQSKFVGKVDFPAFTIFTSQETFVRELEKMDFGDLKVFVQEAGTGVIETEVWR
jgi:thiol-disulfide isomerase/thioredoxin